MLKLLARLCAIALVSLVFTAEAWAIPRFAARQGVSCQTCHVNPTGGGQRNTYGKAVFAKFQLPLDPANAEKISNIQTEFMNGDSGISVGTDLRMAGIATFPRTVIDETGDSATSFQLPSMRSAFLMQDDVYLTLTLNKDWVIYADVGVASGNLEAFAMRRFMEGKAYVKVGQFLPAYGLKLPNHRTYIREEGMGFEPNLREAGFELGYNRPKVNAYVSVVNGTGLAGGLNPDWKPAVTGRIDHIVRPGPAILTVGWSGWYEPGGSIEEENYQELDMRTLDVRTGPYAMLNVGKFTWLGELDYRRTSDNSAGTLTQMYATYNELDFAPKQGLDIQVFYEAMDPEIALTPNLMHRAGAGFEVFPTSFTELRLLYRHTFVPNAEEAAQDTRTFYAAANQNMDEVILFAHFYL